MVVLIALGYIGCDMPTHGYKFLIIIFEYCLISLRSERSEGVEDVIDTRRNVRIRKRSGHEIFFLFHQMSTKHASIGKRKAILAALVL